MAVAPSHSPLAAANHALRAGRFAAAMAGYVEAMHKMPALGPSLAPNLALTRQKYLDSRRGAAKPQVVVCSWELAHNPAGRAHTLAEIYEQFADVEIVGSIFPQWGREIWEPLRSTHIPIHSILVDEPKHFVDQALALVAAHPAETVHLSKPRAPNILFGILYKLLWGARVVLDIDDEELAFAQAETPLSLAEYQKQHSTLPPFDQLIAADWTRLAVGLAGEFDAITVANTALQQRYGGLIISHARDPLRLTPSCELRQASRRALGIRPEQKVVLFCGTPRPHKGLVETACAIQGLHRNDILFVIAGSFGKDTLGLKVQLERMAGVHYLFLENQPLEALPRILAIADCCVLMQDEEHLCASFQTPAKLSDALALRIPVIASATPALADPIAAGAILPATAANLASQLAFVLDKPNPALIEAGQRYFTEHLTLAANAGPLRNLIGNSEAGALSSALRRLVTALTGHAPLLKSLHAQKPAYTGQIAIAVHIFYPEIWLEIAQRLKALDHAFILDITTPPEHAAAVELSVKHDFPGARIHATPNKGMDILPFLSLVPRWQEEGVLAVCKLHTKKGNGDGIAVQWRKYQLDALVGHPATPAQIARAFGENTRLSLVGPAALYLSGQRLIYDNRAVLEQLHKTLHDSALPQTDWGFFAGTMFWARPAALAPLAELATLANNATPDTRHHYAKDGQREHALERLFGLIPHFAANSAGQIGLLHAPAHTTEAPALEIVEASSPAARQHIQPGHATQAVRDTLNRIDWLAQQSRPRYSGLVSIVIPIYNQPEHTAACVASLYQHTDTQSFELILVDNGSDTTTQTLLQDLTHRHPNLRLLRNPENLNFATGCNQGFAASQGEIVVFLNNDTTVTSHWLPPLAEALSRPGVTTVQPKLLYPDGSIQCIGVVFSDQSPLGYPIYAGMKPDAPWATHSRRFQAITGACMALRASDFAELQGFSPLYINGQEDIDLCLRLNQRHGKPSGWVATESTVIHHESKTPGRHRHVETNRRTFVQRWQNKVRPDDLDYYAEDGFSVICYEPDSPKQLPATLQAYRPQLAQKPLNRRPARVKPSL